MLVRSRRSDEIGFLRTASNLMQKQNKELVDSEYTSQIARRSAQLQALQSQINPHFLYNTLQVIGGLALRKNAPEIYSVTTALGDILRYSLNFTDETVSLAEELHYFESYLSIQKQRFGDKLHISIAVPGEIAAAPVPKLILQPILENSFQHGLPDKKACWDISIEAVRRDGRLEITVSDNGVGIPQEKLAELRETLRTANYGGLRSGRHIGLANVNMRIRLRDGGDPFGVDIQSVEGEGTVVTLVLRDGLERREIMNCTAVIIDDEPCVRDVVKALGHWSELGIAVVGEAEDGAAGLELVMQLKPDHRDIGRQNAAA